MASIYGLTDPETGELRYIGKAADPEKRLRGHMREMRRHTPLYCWLRKVGKPGLVILEADCGDWAEAERRLIAGARARGDRLLNIADGGDEPFCAPEVRAANGPKVAAARSKVLWQVYRKFGANRKYFEGLGGTLRARKMEDATAMLKRVEHQARKNGTIAALEQRLITSKLAYV